MIIPSVDRFLEELRFLHALLVGISSAIFSCEKSDSFLNNHCSPTIWPTSPPQLLPSWNIFLFYLMDWEFCVLRNLYLEIGKIFGMHWWLSWLSVLLLISVKVMLSGSWDGACIRLCALSGKSAWDSLPFPLPFPTHLSQNK